MSDADEGPIIVPFGPTRAVPPGHRWCMACDGSGEDLLTQGEPCEVCNGKGYWNAVDIQEYHAKYPHICQQSCREQHRAPYM